MAHWWPTLDVYRALASRFPSATAMYWDGGNCDTTCRRLLPRRGISARFDDEGEVLDEVDAWRAGSKYLFEPAAAPQGSDARRQSRCVASRFEELFRAGRNPQVRRFDDEGSKVQRQGSSLASWFEVHLRARRCA